MKLSSISKYLSMGLLIPLVGCGGDENASGNPAPPPPANATTMSSISDFITTAEVGEAKRIPVYQHILPQDGQLLSIESVRTLSSASRSEHCATPEINGLELVYTPDTQGVCSYEYTVTDGDNTTTGRVISSVSKVSNSKLPDIDKNATVGTEATYPITNTENDLLEVVTVLGSGSAYAQENNIIFDASGPGLQRIIYTLTNETSGDVKMGVINVTASESGAANTPPTTPDVVGTAGPNQEITLSPNITDADGDTVQLISVMSPQGGVVKSLVQDGPINDAYFTNKNFTFQGVAAGLYTVYYTAHDHNGGYNTGRANITVTGAMDSIVARDASFYRDVTSLAYDFTVDLRSYVTSSNPDNVTYLGAEYASDSADKTPANLVMSSNNKILTYKVPANQSGVVKIKYTVRDNNNQTSGTIFISFGEALPTITTLGTTPRVDIGEEVTPTSTCGNGCVQSKTKYEWVFNGRPLSSENDITVPEGYSGESLTLIATPYNAAGQRGVSKSVTYNYPFRAATVSVNKEKAKIGESITMTVNATYLGQPDASTPIKVTPVSATNRQNQSETPTAKVNGSDTATVNTNAAGNATFTLTDPNGKG
ncbi:Ig-like domain-containing protein, partial [Vibrio vulnificus]